MPTKKELEKQIEELKREKKALQDQLVSQQLNYPPKEKEVVNVSAPSQPGRYYG